MDHGGGGQVVGVLAFYCNNPSSNPAEVYILFFIFEKDKSNDNDRRLIEK